MDDFERAYREFLQFLKENPNIYKLLRAGLLEVYIRTKPRLKICFRRKYKRAISWQQFFMAGVYSSIKGIKGKVNDLPISAYLVKQAFNKLDSYEREKLRALFNVRVSKYDYVSFNKKLLRLYKVLVRKNKIKQLSRQLI